MLTHLSQELFNYYLASTLWKWERKFEVLHNFAYPSLIRIFNYWSIKENFLRTAKSFSFHHLEFWRTQKKLSYRPDPSSLLNELYSKENFNGARNNARLQIPERWTIYVPENLEWKITTQWSNSENCDQYLVQV